ncbi:MAG: c-type cytochrome [Gammaproteobacteria bacterium]|nr:c-type cytochrome [Gammaproteobacteria bacterium]MDH5651947.1 c-type cytochrome [Gammaproteobacteria bacterium]
MFRSIPKYLLVYCLPGLWLLMAGAVWAEALSPQLMSDLQGRLADDEKRQASLKAGRERALLCGYCHGEDGNSVKADVPNLAGQNPVYLLQQINKFAVGERKDFVMNSLAGKFSAEEQINLAIFYSTQQIKPVKVDQRLAGKGQALYMERCQTCHGENAHGMAGFARLAGQKEGYLSMTLRRFRDGNAMRGKINAAKRHSPEMESVAKGLSDQDIERLAAYLAQLN